jgi:hypothetical protein
MADIITSPIKFLGATVLSFNTTLGLGSAQESSLNVDLIEDCDAGDAFLPAYNQIEVGAPVYFTTALDGTGFSFGGVLTNWTVTQSGSGRTYNAKVVDPRQLLENVVVVIDSYLGPPVQGVNYYNVYAGYEGEILSGDCTTFGDSGSTERGTPYTSVISKLQQLNPTICSPTGYPFTINWNSFPQGAPQYYRIPGPSITLLQLLQDVCGVLGLEFYVSMTAGIGLGGVTQGIINIGTINLKIPPTSFANIISQFDGVATDLSYGEELRNEVTKAVMFGEKQHYLSPVYKFNYYFGEEWDGENFIPVIPIGFDNCYGFWIKKRIQDLNITLNKPLPNNGPFTISEQDIKAAMASYEAWFNRITIAQIKGSFNEAIRDNYELDDEGIRKVFDAVKADHNIDDAQRFKALADVFGGPNKAKNVSDLIQEDLNNIHGFVQNLGNTYYGKQFFTPLNETICYYKGDDFQEIIFSSEPTNVGGWVDYGTPVLGLNDPDLGTFRETDDRISCFAVFAIKDEDVPAKDKEDSVGQDDYAGESSLDYSGQA